MYPLLAPVDQYGTGVLEAEGGSGPGYRQVQGAMRSRQQGGVRPHFQVGAEQSGHEGGTRPEGTEVIGASGASQGDHQVHEGTVPEAEDTSWAVDYFEEEDAVQVEAELSTVERCIYSETEEAKKTEQEDGGRETN